MARTPLFRQLQRIRAIADLCDRTGIPVDEAIDRSSAGGRRKILRAGAAMAAAGTLPVCASSAIAQSAASVAIVGAGLAGLYAATVLGGKGVAVDVFEASGSPGGRVASLRGLFPGQVAERGAELIDTGHTTVRRLATAFGLTLEDYGKQPGEEAFLFAGTRYSEAQVVEQYRAFVPAMNDDLQRLSGGPTADAYNDYDRLLDRMPLSQYLDSRGASGLLRSLMDVAYTIEFGRPIDQQSALSLLFFAMANRRSRFSPFGLSDERFHIVEGNDALATGLADRLPRPVQYGCRLTRVAATADGRLRLSFGGSKSFERTYAALIVAVPAPITREIEFNVALPAYTRKAILETDYGTSSKMMVGFVGRPWYERYGGNGSSYSDLPYLQNTWETNPALAQFGRRGVLTQFSGGALGASLNPAKTQSEAQRFLQDLARLWPDAPALAARDRASKQLLAHLENWSLAPLFKGGYSNNRPGYFTTLEGLYAKPALPNLVFAGEHTDSFYSYQGYMEGALLSGARAAEQIWQARRA